MGYRGGYGIVDRADLLRWQLDRVRTAMQPSPTPKCVSLPIISASDVLKHLRQVGVTVTNAQNLVAPNVIWAANQDVQFEARQQGSAPNTPVPLIQAIGSHLTSTPLCPYRDFLPTVTPSAPAR